MKKNIFYVIAALCFITSCVNTTITTSSNRMYELPVAVQSDVSVAPTGIVFINNADFFPASFKITNESMRMYIDPVCVSGNSSADFILLTHAHMDHFSPADISNLSGGNTVIICPKTVSNLIPAQRRLVIRPGDTLNLDGVSVEAVPAYNIGKPFHPKRDENVGYIVTINGVRIYHAGDTDFIPEMSAITNIDIALLPIGGLFTMNYKKAAMAANTILSATIIPMHYQCGKGLAEKFKDLVSGNVSVLTLQSE